MLQTIVEIKTKLSQNKNIYIQKYGVCTFGIFGSYARGDHSETSDIDILVEFERPIGLEFVNLADDLENLLGAKVDLVSKRAIKPRMLKYIEKDIIYV